MPPIEEIPFFEKVSMLTRMAESGSAYEDIQNSKSFRAHPFWVGEENKILCSATYEILNNTAHPFLFLFHAPFGFGKTHLVEGLYITWMWRHPQSRGLFLTARDFAKQWLTAQHTRTISEFQNSFKDLKLLVLEDIQDFNGQEAAQEQLVLTLERLRQKGTTVLLTSSVPPSVLTLNSHLISRVREGVIVPILVPEEETRKIILQGGFVPSRASKNRTKLTPDGIEEFAKYAHETNLSCYEMLSGQHQLELLGKTSATSRITSADVRAFFSRKIEEDSISVAVIAKLAARYFKVRLTDLRSKSRKAVLVLVRNLVCYLARKLTKATFAEIGEYFGGRDHTTILHGCAQIEQLEKSDPQTQQALKYLQSELRPVVTPPIKDDSKKKSR